MENRVEDWIWQLGIYSIWRITFQILSRFLSNSLKKMENRSKNSNGNFRYYSLAAWMLRIDPVFLEFPYQITGGPSSSCEMIILRNNSQGGIIRVCMGIFTTALRNKKIRQILKKNTSPYFHSVSLVIWPLTLMKRTHFSDLFISRFSKYIRKAKKSQNILSSTETTLRDGRSRAT